MPVKSANQFGRDSYELAGAPFGIDSIRTSGDELKEGVAMGCSLSQRAVQIVRSVDFRG
jgi:hypothetical protein